MTRSYVKELERLTVVWLVVRVVSAVLWLMYQVRTEAGKVTGDTQIAVRMSPTSYEAESPSMLGAISGRSRDGIVTVSLESLHLHTAWMMLTLTSVLNLNRDN